MDAGLQLRAGPALRFPAWSPLAGVAFLTFGSAVAAAAVVVLGLWALFIPAYAGLLLLILSRPGPAAGVLVLLAIAVEPGAIDVTGPVADGLWQGPFGVAGLPVGPLEVGLVAVTVMLAVRGRGREERLPRLPLVAWAIPVVILGGLVYGARRGGEPNIAYHEVRGLFAAMLAFAAYRQLTGSERAFAARMAIAGTVIVAITAIGRYLFIVAPGRTDVPVEFAFAHEGPIILAVALVAAAVSIVRPVSRSERLVLCAYAALMLVAIAVTGRRAGTLAVLIGVAATAWYLLPRRPALILGTMLPALLVGTVYLGAYWSKEYGAVAQPARAIRSQIDPSDRDYSSDHYRKIEMDNVVATLELNPVLGVGFGNPFAPFRALPDLTDHWPLQMYVAHQNVLWLWLKTGLFGLTAFLATWVIAVSRCQRAIRASAEIPLLPIVAAAGLYMVFAYSMVDTALATPRGAVLIGAVASMALALRVPGEERRR